MGNLEEAFALVEKDTFVDGHGRVGNRSSNIGKDDLFAGCGLRGRLVRIE